MSQDVGEVSGRVQGAAAWITLERPEKRNALSPAMLRALDARIDEALGDDGLRALVLTGRGSAFCAGADLELGRELAAAPGQGPSGHRNPFAAVLEKLQGSPKPVIAAVNGAAFGGGLGLIAASDIAIASEEATFSFSEVRLGLIPAMISVFVLPKIGPHQARRLFTTGRRFSAQEALDYGLVHRLAPAFPENALLESAVEEEVAEIARGGPEAVAAAKRLVFEIPKLETGAALDHASGLFAEVVASEEGREGMAAFAAKRPPAWRAEKATSDDG